MLTCSLHCSLVAFAVFNLRKLVFIRPEAVRDSWVGFFMGSLYLFLLTVLGHTDHDSVCCHTASSCRWPHAQVLVES